MNFINKNGEEINIEWDEVISKICTVVCVLCLIGLVVSILCLIWSPSWVAVKSILTFIFGVMASIGIYSLANEYL